MNKEPTYEELHNKFIYDSASGLLISKKTNKLVGTLSKEGYLQATVNNKNYLVHRIVYCMYHGHFPFCEIDHINRNKSDNRIDNLRDVSSSCNARNLGNIKSTKYGVKGVNWIESDLRWKASIGVNYKLIHIGSFKFFINAVKARAYAEEIFNFHLYDDESPAVKYLQSVEYLTFNKKNKFKKNSAYSEWEFFLTVRKKKIDKLAEEYHKF